MPRLLIVNPNTNAGVTDAVLMEARRCARPDAGLTAVTAGFGVSIVSTEAENAVAAHAALDLLASHHPGHDAAILAISFDTGAFAARTVLPIPVVGITEAALHTACLLGRRFGLIVLGGMSLPLYRDLLDRIGLAGRLGALEVIEVASASQYLDRDRTDAAIRDAALRLAAGGQADVVVVCGAAIAGIAHRLRDDLPIPILDGVAPAIAQAQALADLAPRLRRPPPRLSQGRPTLGLGQGLSALLDRQG